MAKSKKYIVPKYILEALSTLTPPEEITVSEWAEQYRILDPLSSNMPGHWHNSMTPYLVGIMDELSNYETEQVVFCKPTQVGGTECLLNFVGRIIDQDPAPTMAVYPTDALGEATSENRIIPMVKASPRLAAKYEENRSSRTELHFSGMYLTIQGANSPSKLSSRPIKYLVLDEVDKYPAATKKEADPISLALERTKTFSGRKIFLTSTPTTKKGAIWKAKENADIEKHYFIPCPHCEEYIELKFSQLKWPPKDSGMKDRERAEFAQYVCQECGCCISDAEKAAAMQKGKWDIVRRNSQSQRSVAFWLNTLYSPFTRFSEVALNWLDAQGDPAKLQNFTNSWLGEPWEEVRQRSTAEMVLERQTEYEQFILPPWTKLLTAGVDVQHNCQYWTIRAWGDYLTSQNIAHGQSWSFTEIENIMNLEYKKTDGTTMLVDLALMDSGDQTDDVYDFAARNSEWCLPCKGTSTMLSHYKLSTVNKSASRANGMTLVLVDGGKYKDMITSRMRRSNGQGSWMVHKDCDLEYCEQITAEQKVLHTGKDGKEEYRWELKTSHGDNHYLDAEVYAMAAADLIGVRSLFLQNDKEQPHPNEAPKASSASESADWLNGGEGWI